MSATPAPAEFSWGRTSLKNLEIAAPRGVAEIGSIALGALLFGVLGFAMEWRPGYILVAAAGFAASTWLARSLGRAFICMIGALGLLAGVMVLVAAISPGITGTLGIGWGSMFVIWWLVTVALAVVFRASGVSAEFDLPLAVGCTLSIAIAAFVAAKLNFQANLLFYVIGNEDNAAWVGLASQNGFATSIATRFQSSTLGPVMPLLLGVLVGPQKQGIAATNAVFAAYTLAIVVSPLLAAALLRGAAMRPWLKAVAFTVVVFAWLFLVPALLYRDFGHLSTIWTTFGFLAFASLVAFDRPRASLLPVAIGVLLFMGGAWFPFAPLACLLLFGLVIVTTRKSSRTIRLLVYGLFALGALALIVQLRSAGVAIGSDLSTFRNSIKGLYESPGGVAQIDPLLRTLVIAGIVGLSFLAARLGQAGRRALVLLLVSLGFMMTVYVGSALTNVGTESYGATKVAFVVLFSSAVVLVALSARLSLDGGQTMAVALALGFGALSLGGGTLLLQRAWPGDGTSPSWLPTIEAVVNSQSEPRPVACFASDDGQASYFCTRWAGAIARSGDSDFLDYRLTAFKGTITNANIDPLLEKGVLARSDIIFLQRPDADAWWGKVLLKEGGRVFGPTGKPLKSRSISAIELLPPPSPVE